MPCYIVTYNMYYSHFSHHFYADRGTVDERTYPAEKCHFLCRGTSDGTFMKVKLLEVIREVMKVPADEWQ